MKLETTEIQRFADIQIEGLTSLDGVQGVIEQCRRDV